MEAQKLVKDLEWIRNEIIGKDMLFETPYGKKPLVYADYTASGRGLHFIENYISDILQYYANTHTEDDFTGKIMSELLQKAEKIIKKCVNAGDKGKIIFTESGTTGGITRLQQILGVYWPPATKKRVEEFMKSCLQRYPGNEKCNKQLFEYMEKYKPVVLVGAYEHHSNEIMWRQTLCDVMEIPLNDKGDLDLQVLEQLVSKPEFDKRMKIGSFSAASNVTGLRSYVYAIARILHRHNALACFDFAACAPYIEIDMNKDKEAYFDAIYLSPHKFLGGPGSSGILIFNQDIYPSELPPTIAAGGTVDFVSVEGEEYVEDIEKREKPGTPGIIQALKAALAFQLKEKMGYHKIEKIEKYLYNKFMQAFADNNKIKFLGPLEAARKIPVIPFNIRHKDKILHPKFVTRLLNDLFGIQTRAGCACAGPYGHNLMKIDLQHSHYYRCVVSNIGYAGIKPGWVRLNLHYTLSEEELNYLIEAIKFVANHGYKFLKDYLFNIKTGDWKHINDNLENPLEFNIKEAINSSGAVAPKASDPNKTYVENLKNSEKLIKNFCEDDEFIQFDEELQELIYFYTKKVINYKRGTENASNRN
ncbi:MAG: aminotransferase class V-fold PLP-dependent enzyme [Candidatus Cloacimonadota bacterium]|nr:aminotransferase class V-fold PLP-dependent enzyme [Candidatus Cloacimonadota bacterium]